MKYSKELLSGSTPALLLSIIEKEDMYGYIIAKELEIRSGGEFSLKEGTMYPVLHSLEKERLAECYWQTADGRKRKYYHITKKGKRYLAEKKTEFTEFSATVQRVLNFA